MTTYAESATPVGFSIEDNAPVVFDENLQSLHSLTLTMHDADRAEMQGQILAGHIRAKLGGETHGSVTIIDPMGEISPALLDRITEADARAIEWLDFSEIERAPKINVLAPEAFENRDECVDAIIAGLRPYANTWNGRIEGAATTLLELGYEYNRGKTDYEQSMSVADALTMATDGERQDTPNEVIARALELCADQDVIRAAKRLMDHPSATRADLTEPVSRSVKRMQRECRSGESVISIREHDHNATPGVADGSVTVVNTGRQRIGHQADSILANWIIGLFNHTIRSQGPAPTDTGAVTERHPYLLACDGFTLMRGTPWQRLLAESRKYSGVLCLSGASLPSNDHTAAAFIALCHTILAGRLNQVDAHRMTLEMPGTDVGDFTASQPRQFVMRAITDRKVTPTLRMKMPHHE